MASTQVTSTAEGNTTIAETLRDELFSFIRNVVINIISNVDNFISIHASLKSKEGGYIKEYKAALKKILETVQYGCIVVRYVEDLTYYGESKAMQEAINGLKYSNDPDLKPVNDMLDLLESTLEEVNRSYETFKSASEEAGAFCDAVATKCKEMAKAESENRITTQKVGGAVVSGAIVAGIATVSPSIIAGASIIDGTTVSLTAAGVGTALATHYIASSFGDSEKRFSKMSEKLKDYSDFNQNFIIIKDCIDHTKRFLKDLKSQRNITVIILIFNRLCTVLKEYQEENTELKKQLNEKKKELQKLIKEITQDD